MNPNEIPFIAPKDAERERTLLTTEEIDEVKADVNGLTATFDSLGLPKMETLADGLLRLGAELALIPDEDKCVFLDAKKECPELVNDSHKSSFLWREDFNAEVSIGCPFVLFESSLITHTHLFCAYHILSWQLVGSSNTGNASKNYLVARNVFFH